MTDKAGLLEAFKFIRDNPGQWRQQDATRWIDENYVPGEALCFINHYLRIKNVSDIPPGESYLVAACIAGINENDAYRLYHDENTLTDIYNELNKLGVFDELFDKDAAMNEKDLSADTVHYGRDDLAWLYLKAHDVFGATASDLRDAYAFAENILNPDSLD